MCAVEELGTAIKEWKRTKAMAIGERLSKRVIRTDVLLSSWTFGYLEDDLIQ